jgi:hypothetical protein
MFLCTGCQNVQVIEPVPVAAVSATVTTVTSGSDEIIVEGVSDSAVDAPAPAPAPAPPATLVTDVLIEKHAPLPESRAFTPDASAEAEAEGEADADASAEAEDTRMPVNRVASSFDESIYSQRFTVHKVPSSDVTIRSYEGDYNAYVTIDTTEPVTLPITSLRHVLNSIQPDTEKKYLVDNFMLAMGFFFASVLLRARDCS